MEVVFPWTIPLNYVSAERATLDANEHDSSSIASFMHLMQAFYLGNEIPIDIKIV